MSNKRKLSFLIVGTMKSGTTTLADLLNKSANIYLPASEIHFFDNQFNKGFEWYQEKLKKDIPYNKQKNNILIGEKTPTYSYKANCAERIFSCSKDLKLIWIFRNPVKRSFSNYLHAVKKGNEIRSFKYCIDNEERRIKKDIFKGYLERSIYIKQVKRFLNFFDISQMHFILFEELLINPEIVFSKLMDFLECENDIKDFELPYSNKTFLPRFPIVRYGTKKLLNENSIITKSINKINLNINKLIPNKKYQLNKELENYLNDYFLPYNEQFSQITNLDISIWKN